MRQLGIATHTINDTFKKLPPVAGLFGQVYTQIGFQSFDNVGKGGTNGTIFWFMLPHLEQTQLFNTFVATGVTAVAIPFPVTSGTPALTNVNVKTYICPTDPTGTSSLQGTASYAGNAFAFGSSGNLSAGSGALSKAAFLTYKGPVSIPSSFVDGTSNTVLFVERYQNCYSTGLADTVPNYWGANGVFVPAQSQPGIGINPVIAIGDATLFELSPKWLVGSAPLCTAGGAQTAHAAGMNVCLADASVKLLSAAAFSTLPVANRPANPNNLPVPIQSIFNAMLTIDSGETLPSDI